MLAEVRGDAWQWRRRSESGVFAPNRFPNSGSPMRRDQPFRCHLVGLRVWATPTYAPTRKPHDVPFSHHFRTYALPSGTYTKLSTNAALMFQS